MNSNIFGEHNLKKIGLPVQNQGFLYDALLKKGTSTQHTCMYFHERARSYITYITVD